MSNLPVPTGGGIVSRGEIDHMKQLMETIARGDTPSNSVPATQQPHTGHYSGGREALYESHNSGASQPTYSPGGLAGSDDVDAMRTILERFHAASGTAPIYEEEPRAQLAVNSNNFLIEGQRALPSSASWEVNIRLVESAGKETKSYDVVDRASRQVAAENLNVLEAAKAVAKYLNKGLVLESAKVQEVLELEEDFNRNRIQASTARSRYTRSSQLGESAAADVFKGQFETARAKALGAQDEIKSILESIR